MEVAVDFRRALNFIWSEISSGYFLLKNAAKKRVNSKSKVHLDGGTDRSFVSRLHLFVNNHRFQVCRQCSEHICFVASCSSAVGPGGWEGGKGATQSEPLHRDPQRGSREHTHRGQRQNMMSTYDLMLLSRANKDWKHHYYCAETASSTTGHVGFTTGRLVLQYLLLAGQ